MQGHYGTFWDSPIDIHANKYPHNFYNHAGYKILKSEYIT